LPVISVVLTIDNTTGRGVTVKGNSTFRIVTLANSAVVVINNLTISHGSSSGALLAAKGGGIFMGDSATLTLNHCIVSDNTATGGGAGIWVNNSGVLTINDSTISNNTATGENGGGIRLFDSATLNIFRSTVSGNHATATAPDGGGGGIYNGVTGTVNATNITVNGNTAGNQGGGINNTATVTVNSSTISGNTATVGGGGIFNGPTFTATLGNTLVALNTGAGSPDLLGAFTANSSLIGNADGSTVSGALNQLGTTAVTINPLLGPLQDNGGPPLTPLTPTFTRALLAGSPAIDTGATALPTDQRGVTRPKDGDGVGGAQADIGSFELDPAAPTPTPTPTPNTIQFSASSYPVGEGDLQVNLTVTRSGDTTGAASVLLATSDTAGAQNCNVVTGVASSRCDYEIRIKTIRFAAGEISKPVSVFIIDDSYQESTEAFNVSLSDAAGGSLGAPSTATVIITDNDGVTGPNPIDTASFFVHLHYLDFLNREPDPSGFAFWTNEITLCGFDQQCIDNKRINVSAAFYISIEFQETGYLVERLYKTAYGDGSGTSTLGGSHPVSVPIVRLLEFLYDTQEIGNGVIIGQPGADQLLENNKQAVIADFVLRSRFTTAFPTSLTPAAFVDALFLNAGVTPAASDRTAAINEFGSASTTTDTAARARALRRVAENSTLAQQEFNRAFVLMQYFGYLRRNPNDPQDTDHTGYDFWLTKLDQFTQPGDDVLVRVQQAEMVKAFIISSEYRQRVGP